MDLHRRPIDLVLEAFQRRLTDLGGRVLDEPCRPECLRGDEAKGLSDIYTTGCGGTTRCLVPYGGENGEQCHAIVCAIDDAAYLFPRLRHAG